jgi:DNA-binding NarL/FixJ family response regulator
MSSNSAQRRVLIVDDHPLIRVALKELITLQPDLVVCGEAGGIAETQRLLPTVHPDIAVVDLMLSDGPGLDLIKRIRAHYPDLKILVCSMHEESIYATRVLKLGANGYISKQEASAQIVEAIRRVLTGEIYVSPSLTQKMLHDIDHSLPGDIDQLTDRELQVFNLIGEGLKTSAIAERLRISVKTVESHREKIKHKLGLASGADLSRHAIQWTLEHG